MIKYDNKGETNMWEPVKNTKQMKILFDSFLNKYSKNYDPYVLSYIKHFFWKEMGNNVNPPELLQVYSELGIYDLNDNPYQAHLNNLRKYFDIKCNVLDIASGAMPAFANLLAKEQLKLGSGTVTIYEPSLVIDKAKYPNMSVSVETVEDSGQPYGIVVSQQLMDISDFELITGILPCEVTEDILKSACMYQKLFYVAMCGCVHFEYEIDYEYYQQYIIDTTKKYLEEFNNGELVIDRLENKYYIPYPILYNKKK